MTYLDDDQPALSISQLNNMVKELLESTLPPLWVEGEISNFAKPASGHMYFSLKDEQCQVRSVMFRNRNMLLNFKPANGTQVLARIRIGFYEARGEFQLLVEQMEQAGDGLLRQQFERLKQKLASEGLFDEHLKQGIPELPRRIGVITSPTGAAIRDVLSVLQRRFPAIPVSIYPVPVQGNDAAPKIAAAIKLASKHNYCDVLLLVRGGGSLEDLWAFNEEVVARAIAACKIPLVSGIGHEVDTTIADYAADMRAATPSAAAELVAPDQYTYIQSFDYYSDRLLQLIINRITHDQRQLKWLKQRLIARHPSNQLAVYEKHRSDYLKRLLLCWHTSTNQQKIRLDHLVFRLLQQSPDKQIKLNRSILSNRIKELKSSIELMQHQNRQRLSSLSRTLHAVSPLQTLSRGYAIVTKEGLNDNIIDNQQVSEGDILKIRLYKGSLKSRVISRLSDKSEN